MPYKKTAKSVKTIGEELGVEFLVSGTIRWQNTGPGTGRVRVTPSLVRVGDAMQIWARVYDESVAEIFQVQSDISKSLVDALGIALAGREERTLGGVLTSSLAAYDFYLRGVEISQSAGLGGEPIRRAIEMFEKAVAADPGFLRAYAELARLHANYYFLYYDHSPGRAAKARAAADRAFRINPQDLDVEKALAYYYYWCEQDYDQALKYFRLVLSKAPHHPGVSGGIGFVLRRQGRLEEAVGYLKTAAELNPRSCDAPFHVGQTCAFLRDYREAERWYDRALSLKNDFETVYDNKIRLFINQGRLADARRVAEEEARAVARPDPNKSLYHAILLGILEGKNRETLDRLAAGAPEAFSDQFYFMPKTLLAARIHAFAKNEAAASSSYEAALGVIERKIQENPEDSRCYGALGIALAGLGRKAEAVRAARRATEIMPISRDAVLGQFRAVELAQVYAMVGEFDQAFDLIERLLSLPGEMSVARIRTDRIWEPLRALPRFEALARKFRS